MNHQTPAGTSADVEGRPEEFARAMCRMRRWRHATVEQSVEQYGQHRIKVTNSRTGMWLECRFFDSNTLGSMTVGRIGSQAFFQPEFIMMNGDFVHFRARQFVRSLRRRERSRTLRRLNPRRRLVIRRIDKAIARQRRERAALAGAA